MSAWGSIPARAGGWTTLPDPIIPGQPGTGPPPSRPPGTGAPPTRPPGTTTPPSRPPGTTTPSSKPPGTTTPQSVPPGQHPAPTSIPPPSTLPGIRITPPPTVPSSVPPQMPRPTPSQPTGPTGPSTSDRRAQQWEEAENERKKKEQEQKELQDKIREANKRAAERRKADDDKRRVEANQRKTDAQNRQRQPAREPQQLPPPPDEREVEAARDAVRMAWLKAVESKIRARETPAAAGRNAMDAFLEPLEKIVRRGIGLLPWVRYSEMGLTLSVNTQAHRAHMEVAQDREPNNVDASRLRSVHTGIGLPELDKRYRVDFPYYLAPEPVSILTGPRPYLDPWIKVPVGGTWLYYQDGATLHRVDWPPALPPATPTWSNHLSHAVPMLTSTGPHGTTSYNGLYLGPITPKAGLSIFFQTGSWYGATNFCTLLTNPEPSATRASLDHAAVEGA